MRFNVFATAAAVLGLACGGSTPPEPTQPEPVARQPSGETPPYLKPSNRTTLLVKDSLTEHHMGDTVVVNLDRLYSGRVMVYGAGGPDGSIPLAHLGPAGKGDVVIMAGTLNVRECGSTSCRVISQLDHGERVTVEEFDNGWYRLAASDGTGGFVYAFYVGLPAAYRLLLLSQVKVATEKFYQHLRTVRVPGYGRVFSDWNVRLSDGKMEFRFLTPYMEGPPTAAVCLAMDVIADFVETTMDKIPSEWVQGYSAGVVFESPYAPTEIVVAQLGVGGSTACTVQ